MIDRRSLVQRQRLFLQRKNKMTGAVCYLVLIIVVSVSGVSSPPQARAQSGPRHSEPSTKIENLLHDAEGALNRGDYPAAAKSLKSIVEIQPDNASAWFNLGYAYTGLHQNEDSSPIYSGGV